MTTDKKILTALLLGLTLALGAVACGDDTGGSTSGDGDGDGDGDCDGDGDGDGDGDTTTGGSTTSGSTCDSSSECINDVCECTTPGKEGDSCTDFEACDAECEVCN